MKKILIMLLAGIMMLTSGCLAVGSADNGGNKKVANRIAVIQTNKGTIEIELFEDKTPITTKNFIDLAQKGFYDGIIFHRVIDGFMIQGGDPNGDGSGGSDKTIKGEFSENGVENRLSHVRGAISMARSGDKDSASSQFFITLAKTPWLNNHHTIFGKVVKGMDVVRDIGHTQTGFQDRPVHDVVMEKVTIKEAE